MGDMDGGTWRGFLALIACLGAFVAVGVISNEHDKPQPRPALTCTDYGYGHIECWKVKP